MLCLWRLGVQLNAFIMFLLVPDGQITTFLIKTNDWINTIIKYTKGYFSLLKLKLRLFKVRWLRAVFG